MAWLAAFDLDVVRALAAWRTPALDWLALGLSAAGFYGLVWMGLALVRAALVSTSSARMAVVRVVLAVLLAHLAASTVVKPLAARDRPFVTHSDISVVGPMSRGYAFPSGHAAVAGAGAVALTLMWPGAALAWWALALVTMAARVYLGVHYPSDVIAGALLGAACGWLATGGARCYTARPVALGVPR